MKYRQPVNDIWSLISIAFDLGYDKNKFHKTSDN